MMFLRKCGHEFRAKPGEQFAWLRAAQEPCMRCHLENKAAAKNDPSDQKEEAA